MGSPDVSAAKEDNMNDQTSQVGEWARDTLIAHLLDNEGHRVMAYGPARHPDSCDFAELVQWHDADHEPVEGVGPRDGHTHAT